MTWRMNFEFKCCFESAKSVQLSSRWIRDALADWEQLNLLLCRLLCRGVFSRANHRTNVFYGGSERSKVFFWIERPSLGGMLYHPCFKVFMWSYWNMLKPILHLPPYGMWTAKRILSGRPSCRFLSFPYTMHTYCVQGQNSENRKLLCSVV